LRWASCLIRRIFGRQARAVEYRKDDDQRDSVGRGELGEFGAFRDPAETLGGGNGNGGFHGFFGVKLELDFHCQGAMGGTKNNNTKNEEEQYWW
jgi:hypothetical protein